MTFQLACSGSVCHGGSTGCPGDTLRGLPVVLLYFHHDMNVHQVPAQQAGQLLAFLPRLSPSHLCPWSATRCKHHSGQLVTGSQTHMQAAGLQQQPHCLHIHARRTQAVQPELRLSRQCPMPALWVQPLPEAEAALEGQEAGLSDDQCGAVRGRLVAYLVRPGPHGGRLRARAPRGPAHTSPGGPQLPWKHG